MRNTLFTRHWRAAAFSFVVAAAALLTGCSAPQINDYAGQQPTLELRDYFNGKIEAHGLFTDRSGRVVKRFTVQMDCSWTGDQGVLDEHFSYTDGTTQRRIWKLTRQGPGRYTGTADDVIGIANGAQAGNAFHWNYTLALPLDGYTLAVQFDDWMFLMNDHVMLNRDTMRKWGIVLGQVTLTFNRP